MAENKNTQSNAKKIELDSPKSRYMDISPAAMAKELKWSINSIRTKVDALFHRGEKGFSINNNGNYQLYNHECLPILRAYIGKKRAGKNSHDYSEERFLQKVARELDTDTSQVFCRNYLYNQKEFRRYYMRAKLEGPVLQRVNCIKDLSKKLDIYPNSQSSMYGIGAAVAQLDRIIYELTNFYIPDDPDVKSGNSAKGLTRKWCKDLLARREEISSREGIKYDSSIPDNLTGLELRLSETLAEEEKELAAKLTQTLQGIEHRQSISLPLDKDGSTRLEQEIQNVLLSNMEEYLNAVFNLEAVPPFKIPQDCNFGVFMIELIQYAYGMIRYETELMEKTHFGLNIWFNLNVVNDKRCSRTTEAEDSKNALQRLNNLLALVNAKIKDFWEVMRDTGMIRPEEPWDTVFADAVDNAVIANKNLHTIQYKESSISCLVNVVASTDQIIEDIKTLLLAQAITLEYYWRKDIAQKSKEIACRYKEYQDALFPYIK